MRFIKILLVGLLVTLVYPALADVYDYEASGVVDFVENGGSSFDGRVSAGDTFLMRFTLDTDEIWSPDGSDATQSMYRQSYPITVDFNGGSGPLIALIPKSDPPWWGAEQHRFLTNGYREHVSGNNSDGMEFFIDGSPANFDMVDLIFGFSEFSPPYAFTDMLLRPLPSFDEFDGTGFSIGFWSASSSTHVGGYFDSLTPVATYIDNCDSTFVSSYDGETIIITDDIIKENDGDCIVIEHDNVTVDCDGHSLTGIGRDNEYHAVTAEIVDYTIVKNCTFINWDIGAFFVVTNNGLIYNNKAESSFHAFVVFGGGSNVVDDNKAVDSLGSGILVVGSDGNVVSNNRVTGSSCDTGGPFIGGILLSNADSNEVVDNNASANCDSGIRLQNGSDSNVLWSNKSDANLPGDTLDGMGITITSSSAGNSLISNSTNHNGGYGLYVNPELIQIFDGNRCKHNSLGGSSPAGLCKD